MSRKSQAGIMLAVAIFVGLGILAYELSWYASDTVVRVLLAMAIPGSIASVVSRIIPDRETVRYYDTYPSQHKAEVEYHEEELPKPPPTSQDKLNWKQNSERTITL
jgi:hypothetical protein